MPGNYSTYYAAIKKTGPEIGREVENPRMKGESNEVNCFNFNTKPYEISLPVFLLIRNYLKI